ncbi:halocyanin [Halobacteriales archaeon QS_5_70_15]|nr:MAG: halocyanin [Halobacteriales archaeon QS_5_70_15]
MSAEDSVSRRGFLRTATGAATVAGAAGADTAAGQSTTEVAVGPDGSLVFDPETVNIAPGDTVNWVWESDNHNIVVDSQPEGGGWEGTEGDANTLYNTDHEYEHTFETEGTYSYYCQPHRTAGMGGNGGDGDEGGGGGGPPAIPESARTLGIASVFGMLSTLGLAYFFMKYGGDYGDEE